MFLEGHSCVAYQSGLFVFGGRRNDDNYSNQMFHIHALSAVASGLDNAAQNAISMEVVNYRTSAGGTVTPPPKAYHSSVMYGSHMIVTGGVPATSGPHASNADLFVCDLNHLTWRVRATTGDVPVPRCHHVTVIVGDSLYLHGGYPLGNQNGGVYSNDELQNMHHLLYSFYVLNLTTLVWSRVETGTEHPPPMLWGHSSVAYMNNILLFGGVDVQESTESSMVIVWNPDRMRFRWVQFDAAPPPRSLHTAVLDTQQGRMVVFGGFTSRNTAKLNDLWTFDLAAGRWKGQVCTGNHPCPRSGHAAIVYGGYLVVYGGVDSKNTRIGGMVHVLDLHTFHWSEKVVSVSATPLTKGMGEGAENTPPVIPNNVIDIPNQSNPYPQTPGYVPTPNRGPNIPQSGDLRSASAVVRDTLARAQAIRQLADSVGDVSAGQVAPPPPPPVINSAPSQSVQNYSPTPNPGNRPLSSYTVDSVVPYDDERRKQDQALRVRQQLFPPPGNGGIRHETSSQTPAPERGSGVQTDTPNLGMRGPSDFSMPNNEAAKIIEEQRREIEALRRQLNSSTASANPVNPFEVPLFNPRNPSVPLAGSSATYANLSAPTSTQLSQTTMSELMPRMNLNLANPPRTMTEMPPSAPQYATLSRGAVTGLVAPVLANFEAAAAHNVSLPLLSANPLGLLNLPIPPPAQIQSNMSSGHSVTSSVVPGPPPGQPGQQWHPNHYKPPENYQALLQRIPEAVTPPQYSVGHGQQQPQPQMYQQSPQHASPGGNPNSGLNGSVFGAPPGSGVLPAHPMQHKSPSLRRIIKGEASMLSITHVDPTLLFNTGGGNNNNNNRGGVPSSTTRPDPVTRLYS